MRRRRHPLYAYKPDDHEMRNQLAVHKSQAMIRLVFGGSQSGKSRCVAQEVAWWLLGNHPYQLVVPPVRIYCLSAMYRTIQEGIWKHLKVLLPEWEIDVQYPNISGGWQIPQAIRMKNGSQIDFISAEGKEDARRKVQAAEIDFAVIDEELDILLFEELQARRLAREGKLVVAATLVRSEPWCMELEDRAEQGDPDCHLFRFSTYRARDAGHVSAKIVKEMESHLSEDNRLVRLEGRSRRSQGLVYPEFTTRHIIDPFPIPKDWTRYCALDPGWRTFAVLWVAVAPDGKYVVYRELYWHGKFYRDVADSIFEAEGYKRHHDPERKAWISTSTTEKIEIRWIDPKSFGHHESGELRVGSLLCNYGLFCAPAQNDVEAGVALVKASMMDDVDGVPRLRVFRSCTNFLKEIRMYRRIKDNSSDKHERNAVPVKRDDHLLDTLRYMELGGIRYVAPPDPFFTREATDEQLQPPGFKASMPMEKLIEENWKRLMKL